MLPGFKIGSKKRDSFDDAEDEARIDEALRGTREAEGRGWLTWSSNGIGGVVITPAGRGTGEGCVIVETLTDRGFVALRSPCDTSNTETADEKAIPGVFAVNLISAKGSAITDATSAVRKLPIVGSAFIAAVQPVAVFNMLEPDTSAGVTKYVTVDEIGPETVSVH